MTQHDKAIELVKSIKLTNKKELNEATTRSRIIDTVLYDILSWPKNAVFHEENITIGYTDYVLKNQNNDNVLIIEAKKEGVYFEIPLTITSKKNTNFIKMSTLLTNSQIKNAINQVRKYCLETGTEYGAISNGHIWIFFKAFSQNWEQLNGMVIKDLKYFSEDFTEAYNLFSYDNLIIKKSLQYKLSKKLFKAKESYPIKNKITAFDVPVDLNIYAQYISKPVKYFFGDFDTNDLEFLQNCYVDESLYENTKDTLTSLLVDSATPYLENHGIINHKRDKLSKKLSKKITNFIEYSDNKHIVVIYGDRGCGKSTFIKKLIHIDIQKEVQEKLKIVYIDLLNFAAIENDYISLKKYIWGFVLDKIDIDDFRNNYSAMQDILFVKEFEQLKQQLKDLNITEPSACGERIEKQIVCILNDYPKIAKALAKYLREEKKHEIVLILDNTDQYSAEIQDFCFQIVAEIFDSIKCLSIITIREERFFRSKNLGVLDAYETTQYHISSPNTDKVFLQRLNYLLESLNSEDFFEDLIKHHDKTKINKTLINKESFQKYFSIFHKDFSKKLNLYNFLMSCAQKDMRKALDLFRKLVVSGYMTIHDMISTEGNIYTLQIHQVLKPLMTPEKFFYHEEASSVPNIFRLRHIENGSHFTSIRILKYLSSYENEYSSLAIIKSDFLTTFNMEEDFIKNLAMLIEYKLIEANIKVDTYIPEIEDIMITPFGSYFLDKLINFFTYLDLICTDCEVYEESVANFIIVSANEEYKLFSANKRGYRMMKRIDKTTEFVKYLQNQERNEVIEFSLHDKFIVMEKILANYKSDILNLQKSATRQSYSSYDESNDLEEFFNKFSII